MALLYAAHHGAHLLACTVTHGNVPVVQGVSNTLSVLDAVGADQVPVYSGAHSPLAQPLRTAEHVHGADGLGNAAPPPSARSAEEESAAVALVRLARERPGEITLVPVGPLTNISLALQLDPDFAANIKRVVLMGGAIGVPGNSSPVGEANIFCDPEAADAVLATPWEVTWVGLEATMRTGLSSSMLEEISQTATPGGALIWQAMQFYLDVYESNLGYRTCMLHDPLAMALALDPDLATYRHAQAHIELRGEHTRGMVVADLRPGSVVPASAAGEPGVIRYVDELDVESFHRRFVDSFGGTA